MTSQTITEHTALQLLKSMHRLNSGLSTVIDILQSRGIPITTEDTMPVSEKVEVHKVWKVFITGMVIGELITIILIIIGLIFYNAWVNP